jgi:hypothetical protein
MKKLQGNRLHEKFKVALLSDKEGGLKCGPWTLEVMMDSLRTWIIEKKSLPERRDYIHFTKINPSLVFIVSEISRLYDGDGKLRCLTLYGQLVNKLEEGYGKCSICKKRDEIGCVYRKCSRTKRDGKIEYPYRLRDQGKWRKCDKFEYDGTEY